MRDIEILLRLVAMWKMGGRYRPSMVAFLNKFADETRRLDAEARTSIMDAIDWFLAELSGEDISPMQTDHGRPLIALVEAGFVASVRRREESGDFYIPTNFFAGLYGDELFRSFTDNRPTDRQNVAGRLARANSYLAELLQAAPERADE